MESNKERINGINIEEFDLGSYGHVKMYLLGYVYFISDGEFIKIGYSDNPVKRLKSLQTGNPKKLKILRIIKGTPEIEKVLHEYFEGCRIQGEWFDLPESMINFDIRVLYKEIKHHIHFSSKTCYFILASVIDELIECGEYITLAKVKKKLNMSHDGVTTCYKSFKEIIDKHNKSVNVLDYLCSGNNIFQPW